MNTHLQRHREIEAEYDGYHAALNYVASKKLGVNAPKPVNPHLGDLKDSWQQPFDGVIAKHLESQ